MSRPYTQPRAWATLALSLWFAVQFYSSLLWMAGTQPTRAFASIASLAIGITVLAWFVADRRFHPHISDSYRGVGTYVWMPILLPVYIVQTRRLRGTSMIILYVVGLAVLGNICGSVAGALLFG